MFDRNPDEEGKLFYDVVALMRKDEEKKKHIESCCRDMIPVTRIEIRKMFELFDSPSNRTKEVIYFRNDKDAHRYCENNVNENHHARYKRFLAVKQGDDWLLFKRKRRDYDDPLSQWRFNMDYDLSSLLNKLAKQGKQFIIPLTKRSNGERHEKYAFAEWDKQPDVYLCFEGRGRYNVVEPAGKFSQFEQAQVIHYQVNRQMNNELRKIVLDTVVDEGLKSLRDEIQKQHILDEAKDLIERLSNRQRRP